MRGPKRLIEGEDHWPTKMGAWFPGERVVFRGKDLFNDLKDMPWMGLYLYGITGREFTENQIKLFEGIWVICTSYPDPRIWNNRVAALSGTSRSTGSLGIASAIAISEASIYGRRPDIRAFDFLTRAKKILDEGEDIHNLVKHELKKYRGIGGFGRPIVREDERIEPLSQLADRLGLADGHYVKLAFEVDKALQEGRWRIKMNIAALAAALAADQGLSCQEYYYYLIPCFVGGMMPCRLDTDTKPEGTFLPLTCNRIDYAGIARRHW